MIITSQWKTFIASLNSTSPSHVREPVRWVLEHSYFKWRAKNSSARRTAPRAAAALDSLRCLLWLSGLEHLGHYFSFAMAFVAMALSVFSSSGYTREFTTT